MEETTHSADSSRGGFSWLSTGNIYVMVAIAIAIIALAIWLRTGLLQYQGLFEPDAFFYYTAIKQAVANGFVLSKTVALSGYPYHSGFNEAPGVAYMTLIPYYFLRFTGLSLLSVMRWVPIGFGILDAIAAYFLVQYLSKSRVLGLLAMFFVAASSGNIARTAGAVYRGDTFVSFFAMIALIAMLMVLYVDNEKKRYIYTAITALLVSLGPVVWNGGVLVPALFVAATTCIVLYGFVASSQKTLKSGILLLVAMLVAYFLDQVYLAMSVINQSVFTSIDFFILYVPLALGAILMYYLISARHTLKQGSIGSQLLGSIFNRSVILVFAALILLVVMATFFAPYLKNVLTNGNSIYQQNNVAATTQELQPPTYGFIFASFGLQLYLAPIGVLMFLLFAHVHGNTSYLRKGKLSVNMNYGFVVIFVYLAASTYLQLGAIRYNSIISIPLALFSAYAIYSIFKLIQPYSIVVARADVPLKFVWIGVVFAFLVLQVALTAGQSFGSVQADGINPYFLQAMVWLSQNTPQNATVLPLWPDGSVVEGWGNRQAFMDSVGGENGTRILQFGQFLFNTSPDQNYLINNAYKPDYILVRNFWFDELGGIAIEANITNLSQYGYDVMSGFSIGGNQSQQIYQFTSGTYAAQLVVTPNANGTRSLVALIAPYGSNQYLPIKHILFINGTTGNYTQIDSNYSQALNYTLLISLTGRNITSAVILGQTLPYTNLFRFLVECTYTECNYNAQNVTARVVYANSDSKIIKLTYT